MNTNTKIFMLALLAIITALPATADEGMWMLTDLRKQNELAMKELGLIISAEDI